MFRGLPAHIPAASVPRTTMLQQRGDAGLRPSNALRYPVGRTSIPDFPKYRCPVGLSRSRFPAELLPASLQHPGANLVGVPMDHRKCRLPGAE